MSGHPFSSCRFGPASVSTMGFRRTTTRTASRRSCNYTDCSRRPRFAGERMQVAAFYELAPCYDSSCTRSACGRALRSMVWERLPEVFGGRDRILELGCGTGEDAVRLASAGHRVFATDASPEMIRSARLKAASAGCSERIEFHVLPIESLHTLPRE